MSQESPKESQTIPPPPLVNRKQPEFEPATKKSPSPRDETASQQPNEQTKKDNKTQPPIIRPLQSNRRDREEQPTPPDNQHQRSRSRSRNRQRKNFNRDRDGRRDNRDRFDRDNRDNRDRYNGGNARTQAVRRRDDGRQDDLSKQATYFKTKLCPAYQMGKCHKQGKCTFAHGQQELKEMPNFKKTKLCIEYNHGKCPFSSRECKYAHGQAELKRQHYESRHHRGRHDYEAQMRKYRVNTYESYGPSNPSYSSVPNHHSNYSHPTPAPPPPVYQPASYQPPAHVLERQWQMPHPYERSSSGNGSWAGYGAGWVPPRTDMGSSTFPGSFDPLSSTASLSYRPWDYSAPVSNVAVGRTDAGLSGSSSFGAPNPSSFSGGFGGSGPNHYTSSTGSAVYGVSGGQFSMPNPPSAPSGPFMSIPTYHRLSGDGGNSFEAFSMGMGSDMPRRPMPSDR